MNLNILEIRERHLATIEKIEQAEGGILSWVKFSGRMPLSSFRTLILIYAKWVAFLLSFVAVVAFLVGVLYTGDLSIIPMMVFFLIMPPMIALATGAAASYRRLQDCGISGAWSLAHSAFALLLIVELVQFGKVGLASDPAEPSIGNMFASVPELPLLFILWAVSAYWLWKKCNQPGTPGPNKYGPQPKDIFADPS